MISDTEAVKAIERCLSVWSRNLDLISLREWVRAHCGLNPHAARASDPDARLVAERDKLAADLEASRAKVSELRTVLASSHSQLASARAEYAADRDAWSKQKTELKSAIKRPKQRIDAAKFDKTTYQRELMRKRRAVKSGKEPGNGAAASETR